MFSRGSVSWAGRARRLKRLGLGRRLYEPKEACGLYRRAQDPLDPIVAYKCLPALFVGDKDKLHRPFRGGERKGFIRPQGSGVSGKEPGDGDPLWDQRGREPR